MARAKAKTRLERCCLNGVLGSVGPTSGRCKRSRKQYGISDIPRDSLLAADYFHVSTRDFLRCAFKMWEVARLEALHGTPDSPRVRRLGGCPVLAAYVDAAQNGLSRGCQPAAFSSVGAPWIRIGQPVNIDAV